MKRFWFVYFIFYIYVCLEAIPGNSETF